MLYIVATPIGNLEDLSARAKRVLSEVDVIAAEDTRHTQRLLSQIGAKTPLLSLHEHNEQQRVKKIIDLLKDDKAVALVSDAGTPTISDPGFKLVRAVVSEQLPVTAVPGPCAAIAALSASGLPTDRFCFEGFLPNKTGARNKRLQQLAGETRTLIFYLSPHRLEKELQACADAFGADREATLSRELTKLHETFYQGTLESLLAQATSDSNLGKGEMVLIISGADDDNAALKQAMTTVSKVESTLGKKAAIVLAAEAHGVKKSIIKQALAKMGD